MPNVRTQGHKWERDVIDTWADKLNLVRFNRKNFSEAEIGSSRQFSRNLDSRGIDVWFRPDILSQLPFSPAIQCKKKQIRGETVSTIDVKSLSTMEANEDDIKLLFTKITRKVVKNEKTEMKVVTMTEDDFFKLLKLCL
jgi:hypothetical protein